MRSAGDRVDRYVIEGVLGRGGMGEVYDALDTRLGRRVALKLISAGGDGQANARMLREARAAASFEHPNAVTVFDVGEADGETYLAMELVRGKPMRAYVGDPAVPVGRRLRWLCDAARALGAAHRQGIVHRDVKPDNVMIREDGAVKVLDFGIARRHSTIDPSAPTAVDAPPLRTLTADGVVVGTPLYSAPEQLRSEHLDGRADQFAWAVMAYELLSGAPPWRTDADGVALLAQILSSEPPPLAGKAPDLPAAVAAAVHRALSKKPDDRFTDIDEAADAIEPFADAKVASGVHGTSVRPPASEAGKPASTPVARRSTPARIARGTAWGIVALLAGLGGLVVAAIVVGAFTGNLHVDLGGKDAGAAGPLVVPALACREAKIEGEGASPELARAIGVGACARLAAGVGVEWSAPDTAPPVEVAARRAQGAAAIQRAVGGRPPPGKGATPVDAITAAAATLEAELAPPPVTAEQIAAWGAPDAEGARRIERAWRRMVLNVSKNDEAEVAKLLEAYPESPWSHLFAALIGLDGTDAIREHRDRVVALAGKLPPARAHGVEGLVRVLRGPSERKEGLRLLRQAYAEAPDDADVAGLFAAITINVGTPEEGFAVVDRLYARFPTRSIVPLRNAVTAAQDRDLERDARYVERLVKTLPETLAWDVSIRQNILSGKLDEARAALAFGERFGLSGSSADAAGLDLTRSWVELAALEPRAAREVAARSLSDPRIQVSAGGAVWTIASYYAEGRVGDGQSALVREVQRQRSNGSALLAARHIAAELRRRRQRSPPPPRAPLRELARKTGTPSKGLGPAHLARVKTELALAAAGKDPRAAKRSLEAALAEIEAAAEQASEGDRTTRDGILVQTVPLVRAARGPAEAAKRWRETEHAPFRLRRGAAFDAALALEAAKDRGEAERAFLLATDASDIEWSSLEMVAAYARLGELYRAAGRGAEAQRVEGIVARVWAKADPGVREAILRL